VSIPQAAGRIKTRHRTQESGLHRPLARYRRSQVFDSDIGSLLNDSVAFIDAQYRTRPEPESTDHGYSLAGPRRSCSLGIPTPKQTGMAAVSPSGVSTTPRTAASMLETTGPVLLDGGSGGITALGQTVRAHELLEQAGWLPGDDPPAYFDYHAGSSVRVSVVDAPDAPLLLL